MRYIYKRLFKRAHVASRLLFIWQLNPLCDFVEASSVIPFESFRQPKCLSPYVPLTRTAPYLLDFIYIRGTREDRLLFCDAAVESEEQKFPEKARQ